MNKGAHLVGYFALEQNVFQLRAVKSRYCISYAYTYRFCFEICVSHSVIKDLLSSWVENLQFGRHLLQKNLLLPSSGYNGSLCVLKTGTVCCCEILILNPKYPASHVTIHKAEVCTRVWSAHLAIALFADLHYLCPCIADINLLNSTNTTPVNDVVHNTRMQV
jgi:hypothetical protein